MVGNLYAVAVLHWRDKGDVVQMTTAISLIVAESAEEACKFTVQKGNAAYPAKDGWQATPNARAVMPVGTWDDKTIFSAEGHDLVGQCHWQS